MSINLRYNNNYAFIDSPSGEKITASKLERGKKYLQKNKIFIREILSLTHNEVCYIQHPLNIVGVCSKQHFSTTCPNEATSDEIEFIKNNIK